MRILVIVLVLLVSTLEVFSQACGRGTYVFDISIDEGYEYDSLYYQVYEYKSPELGAEVGKDGSYCSTGYLVDVDSILSDLILKEEGGN